MPIYNPGPPALGNVGAYQVSSKPFFKGGLLATTTVKVIEFPTVTNWIHIRNLRTLYSSDGPMIAFSENGFDTNNYFVINNSPSMSDTDPSMLYLKVSKIYYKVAAGGITFDLVAGLTNISPTAINNNWSGSAGVG